MNTHQAKYETALERLEANWKADMANWKADMSKRDAEAAKRETRILLSIFGMIALATAILGFLIRLPGPAS